MRASGVRRGALLVGVIGLVAVSGVVHSGASPDSQGTSLRVRKSVTDLTAAERAAFVDAVLALKKTPSPFDSTLSYYDQFVIWHVVINLCEGIDPLADHQQMAHGGPIFLPWHREYLLLFELALQTVGGSDVTLPYWDWTDPESVASVFADDFMGGNGDPKQDNAVTTGPFRKGEWELTVKHRGSIYAFSNSSYIMRSLGDGGALPTQADVDEAFAAPTYDVAPYDNTSDVTRSFRNALEGFRGPGVNGCIPHDLRGSVSLGGGKLHNPVHGWVGGASPTSRGPRFGTMTANSASPNDPVFFLHHANVDRLWAEWQEIYGVDTYRPISGYEFNSLNDAMYPFDEAGIVATPADVADIAQLGYRYSVPETVEQLATSPRFNAVSQPAQLWCRIGTRQAVL